MKKISDTIKNANIRWKKWKDEIEKRKKEIESQKIILPERNQEEDKKQLMVMEISAFSVFKASLIVVGVFFLSQIAMELLDIVITFLIALFLAAAFNPAVNRIESWGISRAFSIIIIFILVFGFIIFLIGSIVPIVATQLTQIAQDIETWIRAFLSRAPQEESIIPEEIRVSIMDFLDQANSKEIFVTIADNIESIANNLTNFAEKGFDIVSSTIGAIFNFILILLLTFFLVLDKNNMSDFFQSLFPRKYQGYLNEKLDLVQKKIGEWVHGQILLFFIVGGLAYAFFLIMGIPYALTLGMVFGMAEFIPYLGPAISFILSAPVAFNESIIAGLALVIFYACLQFFEGNFIVPMVMQKAVGLPPIVTLLALIIGASFPQYINPILGMILAVPVSTIISIFIQDYTSRNTEKKGLFGRKKKE
jgi:predicted PurR-regulated permease PerM